MHIDELSPEDVIERLRLEMMHKYPFYGRVACSLGWMIKEDLQFPTAATDGVNVYWHPEYVKKSPENVLLFTAVHEVHHVIKKHSLRMGDRIPLVWNAACDYQINYEISQYEREISMTDFLWDKKYKDMLEERIYDNIVDDAESITMNFDGKGGYCIEGPADMTEGEVHRVVDKAIEAGYNHARNRGLMPGYLERFVLENREAQVDWRTALRRVITPLFPRGLTWQRPNRRLISQNLYVPGNKLTGTAELALLIDTSGSVSDAELNCFISEMNSIFSCVSPYKTQIHWFTAEVWRSDILRAGQRLEIPREMSRGGTCFETAFNAIEGNPKAVICLTDMECTFPEKIKAPTIWVATTDRKAPWGTTIKIKV